MVMIIELFALEHCTFFILYSLLFFVLFLRLHVPPHPDGQF